MSPLLCISLRGENVNTDTDRTFYEKDPSFRQTGLPFRGKRNFEAPEWLEVTE